MGGTHQLLAGGEENISCGCKWKVAKIRNHEQTGEWAARGQIPPHFVHGLPGTASSCAMPHCDWHRGQSRSQAPEQLFLGTSQCQVPGAIPGTCWAVGWCRGDYAIVDPKCLAVPGTGPDWAEQGTGWMPTGLREAVQNPEPALPGPCLTLDGAVVPGRLRHARAAGRRGQGRAPGRTRSRTPGSRAPKAQQL